MRVSLCYELISSAERNKRERDKQTVSGRSTQYTNNSDPISTPELLLRQKYHCVCSQILGSPTCVWPLRNREPPAKICRPTCRYTLQLTSGWGKEGWLHCSGSRKSGGERGEVVSCTAKTSAAPRSDDELMQFFSSVINLLFITFVIV
jgi:hypothetical protein